MDTNVPGSPSNRVGTLSGTLLVLIVQVSPPELVKTALLACVGAATSFLVTVGLKWIQRRCRK